MIDKLAVNETVARYSICVDTGDFDGFTRVFTEDGLFEWAGMGLKIQGRDSLRKLAAAVFTHCPGVQHAVSNPVVRIDDDTARSISQLTCFLSRPEKIYTLMTGFYEDRLIKERGDWFIAHRSARIDNPEILLSGKIAEYFKPLGEALADL